MTFICQPFLFVEGLRLSPGNLLGNCIRDINSNSVIQFLTLDSDHQTNCMKSLEKRIKKFNEGFLKDSLILKYERMAKDAFSFFRGTCHLFYEDISNTANLPASPLTWISGDLHVENFGSYRGDNRLVYFDLNDFEEAILAPAAWEIARIITSIDVAFDSFKIDDEKADKMVEQFLYTYSATLQKGKALYIEPQIASGVVKTFLETVAKRPPEELLDERTTGEAGNRRLLIDKDHHTKLPDELKKELLDHIQLWAAKKNQLSNYRCVDVAFRIAGTGSIGVNRYCFLFREDKTSHYKLIDMKEARVSSLAKYAGSEQPAWPTEAKRIYFVQKFMQNNNPELLSTTRFKESSYVIRELQPTSDKISFKKIKEQHEDIKQVIDDMAMLTASAQIRISGRKGAAVADDLVAFGNKKGWQKKLIDFSKPYSNKVKEYYAEFLEAYNNKDIL